jgi:ABC-type Zn uptake system ZnuABC Zn-binding protein ZnuA
MKNASIKIALSLLFVSIFVSSLLAHRCYNKPHVFPKTSLLKVVVSTPDLAKIANQIGRNKVYVVSLIKPGVDIAEAKIFKSMILASDEADVLIRISPDKDKYIEKMMDSIKNNKVKTGGKMYFENPDVSNDIVLSALIAGSPKNEAYFKKNLEQLEQN